MPKYEYVLRVPGRPDEHLISDLDSVHEGDAIEIRNRRWCVVRVEPSDDPSVTERKLLEPAEPQK
jgi:hypothetical protein